nr:HAD family hydrolase [uncultured Agathobaculum sp.]
MHYIIFDVDGTLIDSAPVYLPALGQALNDHGYTPSPEQIQTAFGMTGWQGLAYCGVPENEFDAVMHSWEQEAYRHLERVKVYDGIVDTLRALKEGGNKLGIATSRNRSQYTHGVKPLGLSEFFDAVVCSDDVADPKPAPDELFECLKRMGGTIEQAIFIGDSAYDMQCAHSAGVKSGLALWGCHDPEKMQADVRLAHPSETLKMLNR